jgi:hypothetical protein
MKLWPGWEQDCAPANPDKWGEGVVLYRKPGSNTTHKFKYTEECAGCGESFLAAFRHTKGKSTPAKYCTIECRNKHVKLSEESHARLVYAANHRSPETLQRMSEACIRSHTPEIRQRQADSLRGRKASEETRAKLSVARAGKKLSASAIINRALATKLTKDRLSVALNAIYSQYRSNARIKELEFGLTKDECTALLLDDCHYCGTGPNSTFTLRYKGVILKREAETFLVNGIDRVDSRLGYTLNNVVTACRDCNYAKNKKHVSEFVTWVIKVESFTLHRPDHLIYYGDVISAKQRSDLRMVFQKCHRRKGRKNFDELHIPVTLDLATFEQFVRTQCTYCGAGLSNESKDRRVTAVVKENLQYNGLDRIDPDGIYEESNVVPCCPTCNRAKMCLTQAEFYAWVRRAAQHIITTPELLSQVDPAVLAFYYSKAA